MRLKIVWILIIEVITRDSKRWIHTLFKAYDWLTNHDIKIKKNWSSGEGLIRRMDEKFK